MNKCKDCGASIQIKTVKKNVGKCSKCYGRDKKIARDMCQWLKAGKM